MQNFPTDSAPQTRLAARAQNPAAEQTLTQAGIHPVLARLWAARGIAAPDAVRLSWAGLIPPQQLMQVEVAAAALADAIAAQKRILVVADYDCDGATACAVALRGLRAMGAVVDFLVPNRFKTGYGLSPAVVELAVQHPAGRPDLLLTVDNGIASVDGVNAANAVGIDVIVTDHHLPGDSLPPALALVNPNQPGCTFASKNLAGVGVIFYQLLALRAELRRRGVYAADGGPRLDALADLVALGTVADVVKLDANNRLLVTQGLQKMRAGKMQPGVRALFAVAGREPREASAFDLGFALGPRVNAAGRLADMGVGIQCLATDDEGLALQLARELDAMNRERRVLETDMRAQALAYVEAQPRIGAGVCVYHPDWHQGVIGLVAARLKEVWWRPTLAFARADDGELRGSGRSIPDVHLRDVLDLVSKRHPGMILKFGGHAMAAGLSLRADAYEAFTLAFDAAVQTVSGKSAFDPMIVTDGSLDPQWANAELAVLLQQQVWGAGFPAPVFCDLFRVRRQHLLKDKHLKLKLERDGCVWDAIWFNHSQSLPDTIQAAYRLEPNRWNGTVSAQLLIEYAQATPPTTTG